MNHPDFIPVTLGIEGGGTKTTWTLLDENRHAVAQGADRSSNLHLLTDAELAKLFQSIASRIEARFRVVAVGGAFAGCDSPLARQRAEKLLRQTWPTAVAVVAGEDTHSAFAAAHGNRDGMIVIAGTGSNVQGRKGNRWEGAGGWGHLFADFGGGYDMARRGLEAAFRHFDATGETSVLAQNYLAQTERASLPELAVWMMSHSSKTEVAALAPAVFASAARGDDLAREVITEGAAQLADRVLFVARRLGLEKPEIGLMGSLLEKSSLYRDIFAREVGQRLEAGRLFVITTPGSIGAALMARQR